MCLLVVVVCLLVVVVCLLIVVVCLLVVVVCLLVVVVCLLVVVVCLLLLCVCFCRYDSFMLRELLCSAVYKKICLTAMMTLMFNNQITRHKQSFVAREQLQSYAGSSEVEND